MNTIALGEFLELKKHEDTKSTLSTFVVAVSSEKSFLLLKNDKRYFWCDFTKDGILDIPSHEEGLLTFKEAITKADIQEYCKLYECKNAITAYKFCLGKTKPFMFYLTEEDKAKLLLTEEEQNSITQILVNLPKNYIWEVELTSSYGLEYRTSLL